MTAVPFDLLAVGAAFWFVGCVAAFAAWRVVDRPAEGPWFGRGCFGLWWAGIAVAALLRGMEALLAAAGHREPDVFWTLRALSVLAASLALGSLAAHALLLLTGDRRSAWIGVAVGGALQTGLTYVLVRATEPGIWVGRWGVGVMDETGSAYLAFVMLLAVPGMLIAAAYALVAARVRDGPASRRLTLTAFALAFGFGALVAAHALVEEASLLHGIVKVGGLVAGGGAVLLAYARAPAADPSAGWPAEP